MKPIEKIIISGFRGILNPFPLDFKKGKSLRSMVIYGKNGTGKSSITDAWEWLQTGKIEHLAREGARERSYPNKNAPEGESYIEIKFSDDDLSRVKLEFDHNKVTIPKEEGDISEFRTKVPHPCQIRFGDLTRFVYLTKAEKFDALAQLMGFLPQVNFQKALLRIKRSIQDELDDFDTQIKVLEERIEDELDIDDYSEKLLYRKINSIFSQYEVTEVVDIPSLEKSIMDLTRRVEEDPRAKELSDLEDLFNTLAGTKVPEHLRKYLNKFHSKLEEFKEKEEEAINLFLVDLYDRGIEIIDKLEEAEQELDRCPLCGQKYTGDLKEHIQTELEKLIEIREYKEITEKLKKKIGDILPISEDIYSTIVDSKNKHDDDLKSYVTADLIDRAENVQTIYKILSEIISKEPENIEKIDIENLKGILSEKWRILDNYNGALENILSSIARRKLQLSDDEARQQLVSKHSSTQSAVSNYKKLDEICEKNRITGEMFHDFEEIVSDFSKSSIENVEKRFDLISKDVDTYFNILEESSEGLEKPKLKLLPEQDRAVVLEVEFQGNRTYPAYRYLSESQLNSFGLSVFLASAKHFNREFKFLILDDIINSFDAYKRPQVVKLLKEEFNNHQILLLTHDSIWIKRVYEEFPSWVKIHINRYEPSSGPITSKGISELDQIENDIKNDYPERAGRQMGPYLERHLQEACEAFEVFVKFKRNNEYTLRPLLTRFRSRVKDKLSTSHPLYQKVDQFEKESAFRNFCAHWKNQEIQITSHEMNIVVNLWREIQDLIKCDEDDCYGYLRYADSGSFVCSCGATCLE